MKKDKLNTSKELINNKKTKKNIFFKIFSFVFLIIIICFCSFFAIYKSSIDQYDITYEGGMGMHVAIQKINYDSEGNPTDTPTYYNSRDAVESLKSKLDPLNNKNFVFNGTNEFDMDTVEEKGVVDVQTANNTYDSLNDFVNDATRPGYLYFMDKDGIDLLTSNNSSSSSDSSVEESAIESDSTSTTRTPITSVVNNAKYSLDSNNKPVIALNIADQDTWKNVISGANGELVLWTDIAYFINDLRDITNYNQFNSLMGIIKNSIDTNVQQIFDYTDSRGDTKNLYNDWTRDHINNKLEFEKELSISNKNWVIPTTNNNNSSDVTTATLDSQMDPNGNNGDANVYIKPLIEHLLSIYNDQSININNEFNQYLLADDKNVSNESNSSNDQFNISMNSASDAQKGASLINGSLKGLKFVLYDSYNIDPLLSTLQFKITIFVVLLILCGIFAFLIIYYRLFGFICSLGIIFSLSLIYLLSGILLIQIGPSLLLSIIIILCLNLDSNINFFEHYRKEYYEQNISTTQSYKLANKKTILSILDYHLIIFIIGLIIFWCSTNGLKMFAISLVISCLVSFFVYILITKFLYYLVIKFKWFDNKVKILNLPNKKRISLFKNIKKRITRNKNKKTLFNSSLNIQKPSLLSYIGSMDEKNENINDDNNKNENIVIDEINTLSSSNKNSTKTKGNILKSYKKNKIRWIFISIVSLLIIITSILLLTIGPKLGVESYTGQTFFIKIESSVSPQEMENKINDQILDEYGRKIDYVFKIVDYNSSGTDSSESYNIILDTNIKKNSSIYNEIEQQLNPSFIDANFASKNGIISTNDYSTTRNTFNKTVIEVLIVFGFLLLSILIYLFIRFKWTYFLGVIGSLIFTVLITLILFNFVQIWVTLNTLLAIVGIISYVLIEGVVISSKIIYEQKKYNNKGFLNIYFVYKEYKNSKKDLKTIKKNFFLKKKNEFILSEIDYSNDEFKKEIKKLKKEYKNSKKEFKLDLRKKCKKYKSSYKDINNNYLLNMKKQVIKDSVKRAIIISIIFTIIISILMAFGGLPIGFGAILFLGLNISIFSTLFITIQIWSIFEKYRIFNNLKIDKYLEMHTLELDEEDVLNVNI